MNDVPQAVGQRLGPYILRRKLGEGACGVVWLGHDPTTRRDVAIKLLQQWYSKDEKAVKRFLREAQAAAQLKHVNAVAIHQVGESGGSVFIAMEWVDGGNLQDALTGKRRMPWPEATRAIRDAAAGLGAAHAVGLIHRDIKPSNLMRTSTGVVKVVDFGLARSFEQRSDITLQGSIVGTPAFMSPEQCTGKNLDARSDLYSLVCTYYHLVCGQAPFGSDDITEVLTRQVSAPLPDPKQFAPELPDDVCRVLVKGTQKQPADRYQSAAELIAALDVALLNPPPAEPIAPPEPQADATVISGSPGRPKASDTVELSTEPKPPPPNNLPVQLTSFVGRKRELAESADLLKQARLLTLIGSGGSGKTRLALELAGQVLDRFDDGVWFIELAQTTNPEIIPQLISSALGLREEPGRSLTDTLTDFLRAKTSLLILDNCEHLRSAVGHQVTDLLQSCPNLRILASSRESLRVAGEHTYPVPSLGVPDVIKAPGADATLATALTHYEHVRNYEAVQLFVERAAASQPRFALTDSNVLAVAQICRRVDGIPLALELAAARVKMLSVQQIADRLDNSIGLLTRGSDAALPRQQTLRATIDWSFELLTDKERVLFRRLAVFAGGFALEAAEAVCTGTGVPDTDVLDLLAELVDKSLVLIVELEQDANPRYRLLETIRQYATEKLTEAAETDPVRARHRDFFLKFAGTAGTQLAGPEQTQSLNSLEMEHDNLRLVLDWAVNHDAVLGLRMAKSIWRFWEMHGYWKEGRHCLEQCLAQPVATTPELSSLRATALDAAGNLASCQGEYARAQAWFEEQLALNRQTADDRGVADALHNLVSVTWKQGNYAQARTLEEQALTIRRRLGDPNAIATSLLALGTFAHEQSDYDAAAALYEEALAIRRQLRDQTGIAVLLNNMGNLARMRGDRAKSRQLQEESLAIKRQLGDKASISQSLTNLALIAEEEADYDRARTLLEESLSIDRELGNKKGIGIALRNFGELYQLQGDFPKAHVYYRQSLLLFQELNDKLGITACIEAFAMLASLAGQASRSARLFGAAAACRQAVGAREPVSFGSADYEKQVAATRSKLEPAAFEAAWQDGLVLPVEKLILFATAERD